MTFRSIDVSNMVRPERTNAERGDRPDFAMVPITKLRVDERYQRALTRQSVTHIRAIAAAFCWRHFGALNVSPVDDFYAVTDGQHRAHAAALLGIAEVPCLVYAADLMAQASAFVAINGKVSKVLKIHVHRAAVAANDPEALLIERVCERAGVRVRGSAVPVAHMKPGDTLAIVTLQQRLKRHGADLLQLALECITRTANNFPGAVHSRAIDALCECVAAEHNWARRRDEIIARFNAIELEELDAQAVAERPRHAGDTARARLTDKVRAKFS